MKRGYGSSELNSKALFANLRILKKGHDYSTSKRMAKIFVCRLRNFEVILWVKIDRNMTDSELHGEE